MFNLSIIRCRACSTGFPVFSDQIRLSFSNMSGLLAATVDEYNQIMAFMDFCKKAISPDFKFFFHLRASRTFDKFVCIARWKFLNFLPEDALEGKLNRKLGLVGFSPNSFGSILLNQVMLSFNYRLPSNSHKIPNMCQSKSQNQKMFTKFINIHTTPYGWNCPGRIFFQKNVTFFATLTAVFKHF